MEANKRTPLRVRRRQRQKHLPVTLGIVGSLLCIFAIYGYWNKSAEDFAPMAPISLGQRPSRSLLSEFPAGPFTHEQNLKGGILVPIGLILYMFMGLAKICDDYFEPSLDALCTRWKIAPDVAGATWMAAGGSAPELFTSVIGVFIAKSDIGFGTIVGSAVFNVLAVISLCALLTDNLTVQGWPLARDCSYYCFGIVVSTAVVMDQTVYWWEALILLILYVSYVVMMKHNDRIFEWVAERAYPEIASPTRAWVKGMVDSTLFQGLISITIVVNVTFVVIMFFSDSPVADVVNLTCSVIFIAEFVVKLYAYTPVAFWTDVWNALDGVLVTLIVVEFSLSQTAASAGVRAVRLTRFVRTIRSLRLVRLYKDLVTNRNSLGVQCTPEDVDCELNRTSYSPHKAHVSFVTSKHNVNSNETEYVETGESENKIYETSIVNIKHEEGTRTLSFFVEPQIQRQPSITLRYNNAQVSRVVQNKRASFRRGVNAVPVVEPKPDPSEDDLSEEDEPNNLWEIPEDKFGILMWILVFPLNALFYFTIPDVKRENNDVMWPLSFSMCIAWIGGLSYIMVWMATEFGVFAGIPDPIMGLTILATGTSIPDLLSSLAVARKGYGDMAVSSSVGSNIFDILFGLPFPWLLKTGVFFPNTTVTIFSDGLTIMVLSLFLMVAFVILSIAHYDWVLTNQLAYMYAVLYCLFVAESLLIEYGVIFT